MSGWGEEFYRRVCEEPMLENEVGYRWKMRMPLGVYTHTLARPFLFLLLARDCPLTDRVDPANMRRRHTGWSMRPAEQRESGKTPRTYCACVVCTWRATVAHLMLIACTFGMISWSASCTFWCRARGSMPSNSSETTYTSNYMHGTEGCITTPSPTISFN